MFKQTKRWLAVTLACALLWCSCSGLSLHSQADASPYLKEDVYYCIRNATYGTYLTVAGGSNTSNAYLSTFTGNDNQLFTLRYSSVQDAYLLIPFGVTKSLLYCIAPSSAASGSNVAVRTNYGNAYEYWVMDPYSSTSTTQFSLKSKANSSLALSGTSGNGSSTGTSSTSSGNVYLGTFGSTNLNQYWYIVKYSSLLQGNVLCQAEAQGRLRTGSSIACSLPIGSSGSYILQTAQPNAPHGTYMDTVLSLYNSSNSLLATNDNYTGISPYSQIMHNLTAGQRYILRVNEGSATSASVPAAYLVAYKSGALVNPVWAYANLTYDFKKIGDATDAYNCLAYALGFTDRKEAPPLDSEGKAPLSNVTAFLKGKGYEKISTPIDGCIIAYGTTDNIVHFARYNEGIVTAKLGPLELVQHSRTDAYYALSYYAGESVRSYGYPVAYYSR